MAEAGARSLGSRIAGVSDTVTVTLIVPTHFTVYRGQDSMSEKFLVPPFLVQTSLKEES